jgi:hypothetical protein
MNEDLLTTYGARQRIDGSWTAELDVAHPYDAESIQEAADTSAANLVDVVETEYDISYELITTSGPGGGWPIYRFTTANKQDMIYLLEAYSVAAETTDFVPKLARRASSYDEHDERATIEVYPDEVNTKLVADIVAWLIHEGSHGVANLTVGTVVAEFTGDDVTEDDIKRALATILLVSGVIEADALANLKFTVKTFNADAAIRDDLGTYP